MADTLTPGAPEKRDTGTKTDPEPRFYGVGLNEDTIRRLLKADSLQFVHHGKIPGAMKPQSRTAQSTQEVFTLFVRPKDKETAPDEEQKPASKDQTENPQEIYELSVIPFGEREAGNIELTKQQLNLITRLPNLSGDDREFLLEHSNELLGVIMAGREIRGEESLRQAVAEESAHRKLAGLNLSGVVMAADTGALLPASTPFKGLLQAQEEMKKRNEEFLLRQQMKDPSKQGS